MAIRANKFTPEVLLSAPRRSAAIPNPAGTLALFTVTAYSFETHTKKSEIRILDLKTGDSTLLCDEADVSEPTWMGKGNFLLWLKGGEKGTTSLVIADYDDSDTTPETVASFDGAVTNPKTIPLDSNSFALALTGLATPKGNLYNAETAKKPHSSAKIYSSRYVRHWDEYVTQNTSTIWYTIIKLADGYRRLTTAPLTNALKGHPLETPVPALGGAGDFDISKNGIAFVSKDPHLDPAAHTKTDVYFLPIKSFTESPAGAPQIIKTGDLRSYSGTPVFSPDGKSLVFTRMKNDGYESDKQRLMLVPDVTDLTNVQEFYETPDGEGRWDLKPDSIRFNKDGSELYVTAEENGRLKLFKLPSQPSHATDLPEAITNDGAVTEAKLLPDGNLLISSNSLVDNSTYVIIDPSRPSSVKMISSASKSGKAFGLSQDQVDEFWYEGADNHSVHAWMLKPTGFDKTKKYPLAYLIHGGPQGAWNEAWSTRWNPAIYAEQGYVAVTPNFTGSTGYGMAFQNGIRNNWGGRPYIDLVKGFDYIKANFPYVDTDRAVALGASYGGYMVNWIQGHDFGRKFKALVTHDGVYSTVNMLSTEEVFFPSHEFMGNLWENRENYEKWDPARHTKNWATPHLIIHNELDYRLPISEGLAPFNVLQSKGIPSKFLTFPDENHWVLKPENSLVWHREVLGWINTYSGIEKEEKELPSSMAALEM